ASSPTADKPTMSDFHFTQAVNKASPLLFQLSDTLQKVGADLIQGNLTDQKMMATQDKMKYLEIKLKEVIISSVDLQTQDAAQPIVDALFADAASLVQGLLGVQNAGDAKHKEEIDLLQLSADILKIEGLTIKGELDFIKAQSPGLTVDDFQVKI